jgi:serine/threonine-protein kinase
MATVYLARVADRRQGPPLVAIKRPHPHLSADKTFVTMLVDEARLASAITHPNVVKVRELGFEGGVPFIVMDYIEGASLSELRRELTAMGRALDVRVAVRILLDVLAGLHAAHELVDETGKPLHIVHRDVSPHNILVGIDGQSRITDFGIAKAEDRIQTTRTHEVKGKLAYLAPERVDRRRICTVQSDVFSTAVVLWECFAGRRLFRAEQMVDLLDEVMTAPIPKLRRIGAHIPPSLDDVIARGLARDLGGRFSTALEFAQAIEAAVGQDNVGAHADVARLVEAVFGARIGARHDCVRAAVGTAELADLVRQSGLPNREAGEATNASARLLAELAPAAPTSHYAIRPRAARPRGWRFGRVAWKTIGTAIFGILVGVLVTLGMTSRRTKPAPSVVARTVPAPPASSAVAATPPTAESFEPAPAEDEPSRAPPGPTASPRPEGHRPPSAIGTVRNGFTKLR